MRDQFLKKKKAVHFDRDVFANVICLVLIFTSKAEQIFESDYIS